MAHRPYLYSAKAEYHAHFASLPLGDLGGFFAGADKSPPAQFVYCPNVLISTKICGGGG